MLPLKKFGSEDKKEILISFLNAVPNLTGNKEIRDIEISLNLGTRSAARQTERRT